MTQTIGAVLFSLAVLGIAALLIQHGALRVHLRRRRARRGVASPGAGGPPARPGISVLKPLCGVDDRLEENLASFAAQDYPAYELVLGVRSACDPAFPVARAAVRRWPDRVRVVLQRFDGGLNPKVNQLVGLASAARNDLLVVSDSNVRVGPDYLAGIADDMADPAVGLVTHPVAGAGERRLGSILENLHLVGAVGPAMVAAKSIARHDVVVGKSMSLRRADVERLGGFEAVKDVLAEDYVLGRWVVRKLRKRVVMGRAPVVNVNEARGVKEFWGRYARWSVMQRKMVGTPVYAAQVMLNPVLLGGLGLATARDGRALAAFGLVCAAKIAVDGASARLLRPGGFGLTKLLLVPVKDVIFGAAWLHGLVSDEVDWRGNRLRVLRGTRLAPANDRAEAALARVP
jgi:ceramide glucosyltransferase